MVDAHWLDELSRALARGVSRKDFMRLSGAALAGAWLGRGSTALAAGDPATPVAVHRCTAQDSLPPCPLSQQAGFNICCPAASPLCVLNGRKPACCPPGLPCVFKGHCVNCTTGVQSTETADACPPPSVNCGTADENGI